MLDKENKQWMSRKVLRSFLSYCPLKFSLVIGRSYEDVDWIVVRGVWVLISD